MAWLQSSWLRLSLSIYHLANVFGQLLSELFSTCLLYTSTKEERKAPQIVYAGNSISSTYLADLLEYVEGKDFSVNVISKSGTTTEPRCV